MSIQKLDPMWHEPIEVDGWIQGGTIANGGYKYGVWTPDQSKGRVNASVMQGKASKEYWVRVGNTYYDSYKTLSGAINKAKRVLEGKRNE